MILTVKMNDGNSGWKETKWKLVSVDWETRRFVSKFFWSMKLIKRVWKWLCLVCILFSAMKKKKNVSKRKVSYRAFDFSRHFRRHSHFLILKRLGFCQIWTRSEEFIRNFSVEGEVELLLIFVFESSGIFSNRLILINKGLFFWVFLFRHKKKKPFLLKAHKTATIRKSDQLPA